MNRDEKIKALRKEGVTLQKIGEKYGLTRERVRQIVNDIRQPSRSERGWLMTDQRHRTTCYICRKKLKTPKRFCDRCVKENKLNKGGKEFTRGIARGRDNNTCQVCGYKWKGTEKKRLDIHHLEGLCGKRSLSYDGPEMLHILITVCHKCHYNLHDHGQNGKAAYEKRTTAK